MKKYLFILLASCSQLFGAMTNTGDKFMIPSPWNFNTAGVAFTATLVDADGETAGVVFRSNNNSPIHSVWNQFGTITTGDNLLVQLETVDSTTGNPSGTLFCTNSSSTFVVAGTDDNRWMEAVLVGDCQVPYGSYAAITWRRNASGAFNGNFNVSVTGISSYNFGYSVSSNSVSGYVKSAILPNFGLKFADSTYGSPFGSIAISSATNTAFNNASNPNVIGVKFRLHQDAISSGAMFFFAENAATRDLNINLFDTDAKTVIATATVDASMIASISNTANASYSWDAGTVTIRANKFYYIGIRPTTASNITLYFTQVFDSNWDTYTREWPGDFYASTCNWQPSGPGSWTDKTVQRYLIWPIFSALDMPGNMSMTVGQ